jgi:hypothetical protein
MKHIQLFISVMVLAIGSNNCYKNSEFCHHTIRMLNNSNSDIYVDISLNYPDTSNLGGIKGIIYKGSPNKILKMDVAHGISNRDCFEDFFSYRNDTLMLFIFDAELIESVPWDTVIKKNLYIKRLDLSLEDLKSNNFLIKFE